MTAREGRVVRVAAPAKLNLYLHVTGKRADGYHALDSLITFVDVHDSIEVSAAPALGISVRGPFATLLGDGENLIARAARALAEAHGREPAVAFQLEKRIPVAAGLGGGSADAAAALRALCVLWGVDARDDLAEIALGIGADVPVCLSSQPAFVGGIGERLAPAPGLPASPVVLVNPRVAVPTKDVFAARHGAFSMPDRFKPAGDTRALADSLRARRNDLEPPARTVAPAVAVVLDALAAQTGCLLARMSGSGATCFGLFADAAAAAAAARALGAANPDWWVCPTRLSNGAAVAAPSEI